MSDAAKNTSSNWTPPTVAELQAMLPQYEVTALWGRGGMGAVYKGRQKSLHRDVAIKVLPETFATGGSEDDPHQFVERFKLEARSMANLDHPAILSIHDFGQTENGQLYIVMEFIDGMDIYAYLQHNGGKLPDKHAIAITAHVLDALQYAHAKGVIHRDIKPGNVMINSEGRVKLCDFGLAKRIAKSDEGVPGAPLTLPDMAMGTPDFVAPETLDPAVVEDGRADLYAVGVMLYQLLTGKLPKGQFDLPSVLLPDIDTRFDEVVSKALQANPDNRYPSATAFRSDLDKILSHPIPKAADPASAEIPLAQLAERATPTPKPKPGDSEPTSAAPEKSSAPVWIGAGLAVALLIGVGVYLMTRPGDEKSSPALAAAEPKLRPSPPKPTPANPPEPSPDSVVSPVPEPVKPTAEPEKPEPVKPEPIPEPEPATPQPAQPDPIPAPTTPNTPPEDPDPDHEAANAQLASIPGLQQRLDSYLRARREAVEKLAAGYMKGLDGRMNQAADAGNLTLTRAYRLEENRAEELQKALRRKIADPVKAVKESATLPALDEKAPEGLISLRKVWETEQQKIRLDLDTKLQQSLQALESELTKERKIEEAERIFAFREELAPEKIAAVPESKPEGEPAPDPSLPKPTTRVRHDPEASRKAAEHAVGMGADIEIVKEGRKSWISPGKPSPDRDFQLSRIAFPDEAGIPITDADFQILTQAVEIEILDLGLRNDLQITTLAPLKATPGLKRLSFQDYPSLSRADCEVLSALEELVHLDLPAAARDIPTEDFAALFRQGKIETLYVPNGLKDLEKFAIIGRQTELKELTFGNQLGDEQLQQLSGLSNLETLSTTGAPFTVIGLESLNPNLSKTLKRFGMGRSSNDSSNEFRFIAENFPALSTLHLRGEINADAFGEIVGLKDLTQADFNQASFGTLHFQAISECKKMVRLTIGRGAFNAEDVDSLKKLRKLSLLRIWDNGIQFDPGVLEALPSLRQLTKLYLPKSQVTPDQLDALKKAMPECEFFLVEKYP